MERKELLIGNIKVVLDDVQAIEHLDAVVVVLFSNGKLVMVRNRERAWEFPGGRHQGNETYQETAAREILEEAGAKTEEVMLLGTYTDPENRLTIITCAETASLGTPLKLDEIAEVGFFETLPDELSFGDGREELFVNHARETRSMHISRKETI
ncbi:MAG: NUDIX domain-containing protein [Anaerolineales bacterium]|nr:NUDIX domain-containing protein [Anaerolineales bacterium]